MDKHRAISTWSVSLVFLCLLVVAVTATRPTQAQATNPSGSPEPLGLARAVVVDTRDPEAAGRIKVKFPWLPTEDPVWALVSLPPGGNHPGQWALPEVGDEVVVGFEQGDLRSPIVIGSLWNGTRPPSSGR